MSANWQPCRPLLPLWFRHSSLGESKPSPPILGLHWLSCFVLPPAFVSSPLVSGSPIFIGILWIAVGGIGTSIAVYYVPLFADAQKFKVPVSVWIVSNVVGDIIVTTILVWHLVRQSSFHCCIQGLITCLSFQTRRKTGFAATDDIVNRIIKRRRNRRYVFTLLCLPWH